MKSSLDRTLAGSSIAGTLEYAAPEQMGKLKGIPVGPYSDVFGFGKTCCFALFGTPAAAIPLEEHHEQPGGRAGALPARAAGRPAGEHGRGPPTIEPCTPSSQES